MDEGFLTSDLTMEQKERISSVVNEWYGKWAKEIRTCSDEEDVQTRIFYTLSHAFEQLRQNLFHHKYFSSKGYEGLENCIVVDANDIARIKNNIARLKNDGTSVKPSYSLTEEEKPTKANP